MPELRGSRASRGRRGGRHPPSRVRRPACRAKLVSAGRARDTCHRRRAGLSRLVMRSPRNRRVAGLRLKQQSLDRFTGGCFRCFPETTLTKPSADAPCARAELRARRRSRRCFAPGAAAGAGGVCPCGRAAGLVRRSRGNFNGLTRRMRWPEVRPSRRAGGFRRGRLVARWRAGARRGPLTSGSRAGRSACSWVRVRSAAGWHGCAGWSLRVGGARDRWGVR
jgi:hypothetical protein